MTFELPLMRTPAEEDVTNTLSPCSVFTFASASSPCYTQPHQTQHGTSECQPACPCFWAPTNSRVLPWGAWQTPHWTGRKR